MLMTMYFVPHCTLLTFQILIFSSESLFSNPYLFLRVFIFKSLSFPQSLYFLLYIISIRGVGGGTMCPEMRFTVFNHFLRNGLTNFQLEGGFWYLHFKGFKKVFYARDDISLIYEVSKIILKMVARRANLPELKKNALET